MAALLLIAVAACGSDGALDGPARGTPSPSSSAVAFSLSSGESFSLTVEIADTPEERSQGLMGRESLPEDVGMLFVWPEDTESGFWMKDTLIPLSVAFIDAGRTIVGIEDMQPLDETLHYSPRPYRYAVEVEQGWFAAHGIAAGDRITLPANPSD